MPANELSLEQQSRIKETRSGILDNEFAASRTVALGAFDQAQKALAARGSEDSDPVARYTIDALHAFVAGCNAISNLDVTRPTNLQPIAVTLDGVARRLAEMNWEEAARIFAGASIYASFILELCLGSPQNADKLRETARHLLLDKPIFSRSVREEFEIEEPQAYLLAAMRATQALDSPTAQALFSSAAQSAERVAKSMASKEPKHSNTMLAAAWHARALAVYARVSQQQAEFEFDTLARAKDLEVPSQEVQALLGKVPQVEETEMLGNAAISIQLQLESYRAIAGLMYKVFHSTYKADSSELSAVKDRIEKAREAAIKTGTVGTTLVRGCEILSAQVRNLERLVKPTAKDWGKFSGLITAAFFLPIFAVISVINSQFRVGLGPEIAWYSIAISLIAGFGYGALKFKSFFTKLPSE